MKSMEEYINEVYQKYEETEKNNIKYKTVKVKYHSPLKKLCGIAACVALVLAVGIGAKYFKVENNEEIRYASGEKQEDGTITYKKYLKVDGDFEKSISILIKNSEHIVIVSSLDNEKYVVEKIQNRIVIKTIGTLDVINNIKNETKEEKINYSKYRR